MFGSFSYHFFWPRYLSLLLNRVFIYFWCRYNCDVDRCLYMYKCVVVLFMGCTTRQILTIFGATIICVTYINIIMYISYYWMMQIEINWLIHTWTPAHDHCIYLIILKPEVLSMFWRIRGMFYMYICDNMCQQRASSFRLQKSWS